MARDEQHGLRKRNEERAKPFNPKDKDNLKTGTWLWFEHGLLAELIFLFWGDNKNRAYDNSAQIQKMLEYDEWALQIGEWERCDIGCDDELKRRHEIYSKINQKYGGNDGNRKTARECMEEFSKDDKTIGGKGYEAFKNRRKGNEKKWGNYWKIGVGLLLAAAALFIVAFIVAALAPASPVVAPLLIGAAVCVVAELILDIPEAINAYRFQQKTKKLQDVHNKFCADFKTKSESARTEVQDENKKEYGKFRGRERGKQEQQYGSRHQCC